jgi:spoIIIJ-associated protein
MAIDNGIAFEGATLEEAYSKATATFDCSLIDLQSEIIQTPSSGFLGMFKKNAIIKVYGKNSKNYNNQTNEKKSNIKIKNISNNLKNTEEIEKKEENYSVEKNNKKESPIFDNFYTKDEKQEFHETMLGEISLEIDSLFDRLNYKLNPVKVSMFDEDTIYIEFSGEDSALLIGKEGYRYKAVSYILFNWIHEKYGKMIRLEIAQFLSTQEENVKKYLVSVIETIKQEGYFKTKTFDGILVHIALKELRETFPNKYVAVKTNVRGEKYILINEYRN